MKRRLKTNNPYQMDSWANRHLNHAICVHGRNACNRQQSQTGVNTECIQWLDYMYKEPTMKRAHAPTRFLRSESEMPEE